MEGERGGREGESGGREGEIGGREGKIGGKGAKFENSIIQETLLVHQNRASPRSLFLNLVFGHKVGSLPAYAFEQVHQAGIEPAIWGSTVPRSTTELLVVGDIWREKQQ